MIIYYLQFDLYDTYHGYVNIFGTKYNTNGFYNIRLTDSQYKECYSYFEECDIISIFNPSYNFNGTIVNVRIEVFDDNEIALTNTN